MTEKELNKFATQIRLKTMQTLGNLGSGHVGGCLSMAEILAVLYGNVMNVDPKNPKMEDRDRLVISKGHSGPALYATLALKGFFDESWLMTLNQGGTNLPSHCDRNKTPGVDMTTGSLGQGVSAAEGMALGARMRKLGNWIYCIIGDGESDEGQIWESVLSVPQFKLDNLILFIDDNKQQIDGRTEDVLNIYPLDEKYEAFHWHVQKIDGHDVVAIENAINAAKAAKGKPSVIILETEKGRGCSIYEHRIDNHHMGLDPKDVDATLKELTQRIDDCK